MIQKLLDKLKSTDSRVWKLLLGILLGVAVFFGAWYLRKLKRRVTKLEAQKALFEEKKADAELKAKLEKDEQEASRLHEEAKKLTAVASNKEKEYNEEKKEHDRIKKAIDNATTWRELEKLTKEEK